MHKFLKRVFILPLLCVAQNSLLAQEVYVSELKDIIYWLDSTDGLVNNRILDIIEGKDQSLNLLIKSESEDFSYFQPRFAKIDQNGKISVNELLRGGGQLSKTLFMSDLRNLTPLKDDKFLIAGTAFSNDIPGLYEEVINVKGETDPFALSINFKPIYNGSYVSLKNGAVAAVKTIQSKTEGLDVFNMWSIFSTTESYDMMDKQFKIASVYSEFNVDLKKDENENLFVLGYRYTTPEYDTYHPILYKTDQNGTVIWSKELPAEVNPQNLQVEIDKSGNVLIVNGYGSEQLQTSFSSIYIFNNDGDSLSYIYLEQMRAAGVLAMSTGNYMVYGSSLKSISTTFKKALVNRAKTILLSPDFELINEDEMCANDAPDFILPSYSYIVPPSSDFLNAIELSNGRVACVGRVYMPIHTDVESIRFSSVSNRSLIVFTDPNGGFGNQLEK